jgi:hypothetical protein
MGARRRVALALIPLALLWLGVLWAAFGGRAPQSASGAPPQPPSLQEVVASGAPSPAGGSFDRFAIEGRAVPAAANRRGDIVFFATLLRSRAEEGVFLASERGIEKLAAIGDTVPSGERIAGFGENPAMAINEAGIAGFIATLTGGKATEGVFLVQKGKLTAVALSGAAAPDGGGTLAEFQSPVLNDGGEVAFLATLRRGREAGEAIYLWRRGQLVKIVATGDRAPSGGIFTGFGNPALNNKGEVAFGALTEQGPILGGIFTGTPGDLHHVLAAGSAAPTGGIFARFSERLDLNDASAIAFSALMRQGGPSAGIFLLDGEAPRPLAVIGDAAPGGGNFAGFGSWPVMSGDGSVGFIASLDGGPNGLGVFLAGSDGLKRLAAVGDGLPGGARLATFPLYPSLAISPSGAVTFAATAEREGQRKDALYYYGPPRGKR